MKNLLLIIFLIPLLTNCQTDHHAVSQFLGQEDAFSYSRKCKNNDFKRCWHDKFRIQYKNDGHWDSKNGRYESQIIKYAEILINFEKQNRFTDFCESIFLKSKVAKTRNKDYLDLKKDGPAFW